MICGILLLFGLCGCQTGNRTETLETSEEPVTITIWTNKASDSAYMKQKIAEYNESNEENIRIEYEIYVGNYEQAIEVAASTSKLPDILYAGMEDSLYRQYIQEERWLDLSPYLSEELQERLEGGIYPEQDGRIYQVYTRCGEIKLYYNKEIFKRCGIENPPETMAEMIQYAAYITDKLSKNGIYGFAQNMKEPESAVSAALLAGMARDTGVYNGFDYWKGRYDFTLYSAGVNALKALLSEECGMPGCEYLTSNALHDLFARGKIAMYFADSSQEDCIYQNLFPMDEESYGSVSIPKLSPELGGKKFELEEFLADPKAYAQNTSEEGRIVCDGVQPIHLSGGWVVTAASQHEEEALTVLWELLYSEEFLEEYCIENAVDSILYRTGEATGKLQSVSQQALSLPEAPHVFNPEGVQVTGNGVYDVLAQAMLGERDVAESLQELTEQYNGGYGSGIINGKGVHLKIVDYDPGDPEATRAEYLRQIMPLYKE